MNILHKIFVALAIIGLPIFFFTVDLKELTIFAYIGIFLPWLGFIIGSIVSFIKEGKTK